VVFGYWFAAWAWLVDPFDREQYWKIVSAISVLYAIASVTLEIIWRLMLRPRFLKAENANVFGLVTVGLAYLLAAFMCITIPIYLNTWLFIGSWSITIILVICVILYAVDILSTILSIFK
jgi:hypothetical protein